MKKVTVQVGTKFVKESNPSANISMHIGTVTLENVDYLPTEYSISEFQGNTFWFIGEEVKTLIDNNDTATLIDRQIEQLRDNVIELYDNIKYDKNRDIYEDYSLLLELAELVFLLITAKDNGIAVITVSDYH